MLNVTELRKGNLTMDQLTGEWMEVESKEGDDIMIKVIDRSKYPLPAGWKMIPIPLTAETLKRIGITAPKVNSNIWEVGRLQFAMNNKGFFPIIKLDEQRGKNNPPLQYIHELQNYFLHYTKQELPIILNAKD